MEDTQREPRPDKIAAVEELKASFEASSIAIATKYQGITVAQVTDLRAKLRDENIKFKVYKNTLTRRALNELDLSDAAVFMDGPTAWAFCEDPVAPAKILKDFAKEVSVLSMQGGVLDGKTVSADQLDALASLPAREQLLSMFVGTLAAPLRKFLGTVNAVPQNFVNVLDQIKKQKEETADA